MAQHAEGLVAVGGQAGLPGERVVQGHVRLPVGGEGGHKGTSRSLAYLYFFGSGSKPAFVPMVLTPWFSVCSHYLCVFKLCLT